MTLLFDPNEKKDRINRKKRGISFDETREIFSRPGEVLAVPDRREEYGEDRFINIGPIGEGVLLVVVHTIRKDMIRTISARKANKRETRRDRDYFKTKA
ncbi:MAG: BrnT family toxin [Pseudomonadota bacterium]|nr:BrnT family toxin [Pseudomonadota bacterium]